MDTEHDPQVRRQRVTEALGTKFVDKTEKAHDRALALKRTVTNVPSSQKVPSSGFDGTPLPRAPSGYTLKFIFHGATNLPIADINSLSSDPFIRVKLVADIPRRHKQDPVPTFRTPTVRRSVNPVWNSEWTVANVPDSGFRLECRVFDEDPVDHDDDLGHVHIDVPSINDEWEGIRERSCEIKIRSASKRAYLPRVIAMACSSRRKLHGRLVVSVQSLGKTPGDNSGQMYTVGPIYWFKHFSPLIGRIINTKNDLENTNAKGKITKYNFQAVEIQLAGPVPPMLYHRYVEFRPFITWIYTRRNITGWILSRTLHHQHTRIYNYDRTTVYGKFGSPCLELTREFLDFTFHGQGGRVFTYVLMLDGMFRFTETGKEFGIDMLSKHTMHSDIAFYIAFSGEFFVRRYHRHDERPHQDDVSSTETSQTLSENATEQETIVDSYDPKSYELVIDNNSGTYRPSPKCLRALREFLSANFLGLRITTLDCQADMDLLARLKERRHQEKPRNKHQVMYRQRKSKSDLSLSGSDVEEMVHRTRIAPERNGGLSSDIRVDPGYQDQVQELDRNKERLT